jgi:lycopene cyclase domain-containing protein
VVLYATKDRLAKMSTPVLITAIVLLMAAGMAVRDQGYTLKALSHRRVLVGPSAADQPALLDMVGDLLHPRFLLVNSALTALPVVEYDPKAIFGLRVVTIPIEDFFYNYAMLSLYLLFYRRHRKSLRP